MKKFRGSSDYVASQELMNAVNVAIALEKPLLIKGEPGTGKTMLAQSIADALEMPLIIWSIKSTTKAQEGLYMYDTVQRLYDSQFGEGDVSDIKQYIKLGKLGEAFTSDEQKVVVAYDPGTGAETALIEASLNGMREFASVQNSFGQPILYFDKSSKGAQAYTALAEEFLTKNRT